MVSSAATGAAANPAAPPAGASRGGVPFRYASNYYAEKMFVDQQLLDATTHEVQHNVNPGGFLRGVRVQLRSAGGAGGTPLADAPWSTFSIMNLQNISGDDILFPMPGYNYYLRNLLTRPWWGDPGKRFDASTGQNPSGTLFLSPEIRHTAGVLANTDARATYRERFTFAPASQVGSGYTTAPTCTVTSYLATWAQPDKVDLHGNPNEGIPDGLAVATKTRQNVFNTAGSGSDNVFQVTNTGNEIRAMIGVLRDGNGARQDLIQDPIRLRIDDRSLGTFSPDEFWHYMVDQLSWIFSTSNTTRPAGVYPYLRYFGGLDRTGNSWLQTTSATFLQWEFVAQGANLPGTFTVITDEVVPIDAVPNYLDSV